MIRFSLKGKIFLISILILASIALIVFAIILPTKRQIDTLGASVIFTETTLTANYDHIQLLKKSIHELKPVYAEVASLAHATVSRDAELELITEFEDLAHKNHIVQQVSIGYQNATPPYFLFTFYNTGSFDDHIAYLAQLEHTPYLMNINSLNWQSQTKQSASSTLSLRFQGKIYITQTEL